jgi:hypothetical protein
MPILTLREVEAMRNKEAELGIVRNEGWAWVNGFGEVAGGDGHGAREGDGSGSGERLVDGP